MISKSFKKQLIVNIYNTQLLSNNDKIRKISINSIERIKIWLLFKRDESFLWLDYRYKNNNIDYDIRWFLSSLIDPIYSIYNYTRNKNTDIQENISSNIKEILDYKFEIDEYKDYTKYLEDVHD